MDAYNPSTQEVGVGAHCKFEISRAYLAKPHLENKIQYQ